LFILVFVAFARGLWAQRKFSFKSLIFIELLYNMLFCLRKLVIQGVSNAIQCVGQALK